MKKRETYLDTIKFLAIFVIYSGHFSAEFDVNAEGFWSIVEQSYIFRGISGKFCVTVLGIIMGYLAFCSGKQRKQKIAIYAVKRYAYFVISGLLINLLYYFVYRNCSIFGVIITSVKLGANIYPTFWCIRDFLLASVLCYVFGYFDSRLTDVLIIELVLLCMGQLWIAICFLGSLCSYTVLPKFKEKRSIKILSLIISVLLIRVGVVETRESYYLGGLAFVLILVVIVNSESIKRFLGINVVSNFGKNVLAIFLIHPLCYDTFGRIIIERNADNFSTLLFVSWVCTFVLILILSYPTKMIIDFTYNMFCKGMNIILRGKC